MKKNIILILLAIVMISCGKNLIIEEESGLMFTSKDDTVIVGDKPVLYNDSLRGFNVNNLLEFTLTDDKKLQLKNFLPHTFKDLTLYAYVKDTNKRFKIAYFDKIEAFKIAKYSFSKLVYMRVSKDRINKENIKFEVESSDSMFAKIKQITIPTRFSFGIFGTWDKDLNTHTNRWGWERLYAKDARDYMPLVANIAYALSSNRLKKDVLNAPFDFSNECKHNSDGTLPKGCKKLDRNDIIKKFTNVNYIYLGLPTRAEGLGGGKNFGLKRKYINNPNNVFYKYDLDGMENDRHIRYPLEVFAHEFSHICGYGHKGNMAYIGQYIYPDGPNGKKRLAGMSSLIGYLYQDMLKTKELPFTSHPNKN